GGPSIEKVAGLSAAMIGVVAVAYLGMARHGFPGRFAFPPAIDRLAKGSHDLEASARRDACWLDGNAPPAAFPPQWSTPPRPAEQTVVRWGDSYAARLHPGLPMVLQFTRTSCPPLLMVSNLACQRGNEFVLGEIARLRPGTVVLFGDWARRHSSWEKGGYDVRQLGITLDALKAAGVTRIVVLGPAPQWAGYLPRLLVARWLHGVPQPEIPQRTTLGSLQSGGRSIERVMRDEVERHGATYVSLLDVLCNGEGCLVETAGELTTWDDGHFMAP